MPTKLAPPQLAALHPFQSFWILQTTDNKPAVGILPALRKGVADLLKEDDQDSTFGKGEAADDLETEFLVYERRRSPGWTDDPRFVSAVHHLCVISARGAFVCIYHSEDRLGGLFEAALGEGEPKIFASVRRVPADILNEAFVKGDAKTLWLKGTHRSTSLKPDRKVIVGKALQEALEPLGDQSYAFTAARCQHDSTKKTLGVSPVNSSVWVGPSKSWADYKSVVIACCDSIDEALSKGGNTAPLPVLASRADIDFSKWGDALEISAMTDSIAEGPTQEGGKAVDEAPFSAFFNLVQAVPPLLVADVLNADGQPQGRFKLSLRKTSDRDVSWSVEADGHKAANSPMLSQLISARGNLQAWFENGYHVSAGAAYETRFRDVPFHGFEWHNFGETQICQEKPEPLSHKTIGTQKSLFCWFLSSWAGGQFSSLAKAGWLGCNDGSMEIADFVHLTEDAEPILTLIHVKGAMASGPTRNLSLTAHEVVVSQAVKNLRFLDSKIVGNEFGLGLLKGLMPAVWRNGVLADRDDMMSALSAVGLRARRRVVIVQPHTRKSVWTSAAAQSAQWREKRRRQQLASLLSSAQQSCAGLSAEFVVMADAS